MAEKNGSINAEPQEFPKMDDPESAKQIQPAFAGMGKDLVLHYSNTPFWNRLRRILFLLFVLTWFSILGAVIYLTVTHQKCKPFPSRTWWEKASIYQIDPKSFKDSDGDGVGDLKGISDKLDYLSSINVGAVLLSSFYKTAKGGSSYEVIDHKDVDPSLGSMNDFNQLLKAVHDKGMKILVDFIPGYTSSAHEWFSSSLSKDGHYDSYYIWKACDQGSALPNNWLSLNGESAWKYNGTRDECYLHLYGSNMPELNLRNTKVREELDDILHFWLAKGVDGFVVNSASYLYEDYFYRNESLSGAAASPNDYNSLFHNLTRNQPDNMDSINRWRGILDGYSESPRVLITDAEGTPEELRMYYGRTERGGAHITLNNLLLSAEKGCNGSCLSTIINNSMKFKPENFLANWRLGKREAPRVTSRVGMQNIDAYHTLMLLLPGIAMSYYGDEIGMVKSNISSAKQDFDPMLWTRDAASCHGFTDNCTESWFPSPANASSQNVEAQSADPASSLNLYKLLSALRRNDSFLYGDWKEHIVTDSIYSFLRYHDGVHTYLVAINIGVQEIMIDLSQGINPLPADSGVKITAASGNAYQIGSNIQLQNVKIQAGAGVVITWPYIIKDL